MFSDVIIKWKETVWMWYKYNNNKKNNSSLKTGNKNMLQAKLRV